MIKAKQLFFVLFNLLIGVGVFVSCKNGKVHTEHTNTISYDVKFPKDIVLEGEGIVMGDILMRYPYRIAQLGRYLFLLDFHAELDFCHVIDTVGWLEVALFAPRGNGPDETLQAMNLQVISLDSIWVYDTNKREAVRWSFEKELHTKDTILISERVRMKENMLTSANCVVCGGTNFFVTDPSGRNRIVRCNGEGEIIERIGVIPTMHKQDEESNGVLAQAWNSFIDYNSDSGILAVVTQLGDVIEIYDRKNDMRHLLYGSYGEPEYKTTRDGYAVPVGIMGYSDVKVTGNYIYALFHGRSFKDIAKDPLNTPDGGEYIHVYTHDGTPVCRLVLDHAVYGIHVNEEEGIIWATDVNTEEQIVKYRIPKLNE